MLAERGTLYVPCPSVSEEVRSIPPPPRPCFSSTTLCAPNKYHSLRYEWASLFGLRLCTSLCAMTAQRFFRFNSLPVHYKHRLHSGTAHRCFWLTISAVLSKHCSLQCSTASLPLPHPLCRAVRALLFTQESGTANRCSFHTILAVISDQRS